MRFISFHVDLIKTHSVSYLWNTELFQLISSDHLSSSVDEILTKADIHSQDVKDVKSCLLCNLQMQREICQHDTSHERMQVCMRRQTGMNAEANFLLHTHTHANSHGQLCRKTNVGTHLFTQPIKWQWGASVAGSITNETTVTLEMPRQQNSTPE